MMRLSWDITVPYFSSAQRFIHDELCKEKQDIRFPVVIDRRVSDISCEQSDSASFNKYEVICGRQLARSRLRRCQQGALVWRPNKPRLWLALLGQSPPIQRFYKLAPVFPHSHNLKRRVHMTFCQAQHCGSTGCCILDLSSRYV